MARVRVLVFRGDDRAALLRARTAGDRVVAWDEAAAAVARDAGVEAETVSALLGPEADGAIEDAAIAWTKDFGSKPLVDGRPLRGLLRHADLDLWWLAELHLFHATAIPRRVRRIEAFARLLEALRPDEVAAAGLSAEDHVLLGRTATALGVYCEAPRRASAEPPGRVVWRARMQALKLRAAVLKRALGPAPALPPKGPDRRALFLSHAAFWRSRRRADGGSELYEHYFDRLIPGLAAEPGWDAAVVAVGPRAAFRRRGLRERVVDWFAPAPAGPYVHMNAFATTAALRATRDSVRAVWRAWRELRDAPGLRDALVHRGVRFAEMCAADVASVLLEQLPWAIRSHEETREALQALRPDVLVLYAESSGWGRVAVAAARAAGVRSVAMQHGLLYPRYYSYLHRGDEADAPRPDRTALFGEAARRFLVAEGGYAPDSLSVTGSPRFDALVAQARGRDREALRAGLGVLPDEKLVLVASRYRGIRETHPALGAAFARLAAAIEADPRLRGLVKPHPAESPAPYLRDLGGRSRTALAAADADLVALMAAADVLVTVESLSAIEALVLGLPVVVLQHPTHLRALVEAGVAVGVASGADPGPALERVLYDPATRAGLDAARARYVDDVACGADGQAVRRILDLVQDSAR
jgi:glycosyltransferase involved in cell wall biosynthesis